MVNEAFRMCVFTVDEKCDAARSAAAQVAVTVSDVCLSVCPEKTVSTASL